MGKKSGPPPPDYTGLAEKTAASQNDQLLQQTYANRITQNNPWGSISYQAQASIDPATGKPVTAWTQNTTLNPEQQQALDQQMQMQTGRSNIANTLMPQVQQQMGQQIDFSKFTPMAQGAQAGNIQATTNPFGLGPQQQNIDTSRQGTPQLQNQINYGNLQQVQGSAGGRDAAYNQLMSQATSRLDPQWQQRQSQMDAQLANQGITRGSAAYDKAMQQFGQQRTDAYNQAMMSAQAGATQQASQNQAMDMGLRQQQAAEAQNQAQFYNQSAGQQFGFGSQAAQQQLQAQQAAYQQALASGQYGLSQQNQAFNQQLAGGQQNFQQQQAAAAYQNQLRQQQIAEAQQQQNWSLNALNALLSGQQVGSPQFANFNQAAQGSGVNYSQAGQDQFQAGMQQQQMQNQAVGQAMQGLSGIGGMFMMSDRRTKTEIRRIARHWRGFGIYRYRFIGESRPRVGVMADEVQRILPHAVMRWHGVLMVNYDALD